jgi:FkbM family methyltransferase
VKNPLTSLSKRLARLRRHPLVARRRGGLFLLDPHNWIDNRLLAGAPFENAQIDNARATIAEKKLDLFIDIGANIGFYSVLLGLMPQVKQVIAFEPVRRNHAQLMGNLYLNGLTAKAEAHRLGLAEKAGEVVIHIDPNSTGVSRVDLGTAARDTSVFRDRETIRLARFDDICSLKGVKAFVKIDVEGGAVGVLSGMTNFLRDNEAVLQVELSDAEHDGVERLLTGAGFKKIRVIEADAIFERG